MTRAEDIVTAVAHALENGDVTAVRLLMVKLDREHPKTAAVIRQAFVAESPGDLA